MITFFWNTSIASHEWKFYSGLLVHFGGYGLMLVVFMAAVSTITIWNAQLLSHRH